MHWPFLEEGLMSKNYPREDYEELLRRFYLFLGGEGPAKPFYCLGALHEAWWMAKTIYCHKQILKSQLSLAGREKTGDERVALSVALVYCKQWHEAPMKNAGSHAPRGPTKVQPFNLSEGRKALADDGDQQKNKFVSLAELNMKFYSNTPQRFRTKPKNEDKFQQKKVTQSSSSCSSMPCTRPQSPHLSTRSRSRPVNHLSREQIEEQEMAEALKHQVKAHPLNPKVFEAPKLNAAVPVKAVTQPEPFNITTTKKELAAAASMTSFSDMLDDSLGSVPHAGVPQRQERTSTKVLPFSFDTRDQRMFKRKQEKIEETIAKEKALAEFHALPMPVFDGGPKGLPSKKPPSATKPAPFDLKIDKRAEARKLLMEKEQEEREQRERELRSFHARAATVVSKDPFLPERSYKPLTDISAFELNTEKRSKERHDFDLHIKQREDEIMAKKRQEEEQRAAEEEARIAEERKRNVHKAKPVPQYKPLQIHPSEKPITAALSPKFATDGRLRSSRSRLNINATINTTTTSSHSASSNDSTIPR
ncbi:TPX2 C-terminal [Trinorchestia longiramus]|nr:TPX2 C-terminal [Trinorchestia longiramus]